MRQPIGKPPGVSRSRNLGASFASTGNPRGFRAHATWARRLRQRETPGGFALTQPGRVVCVNGKPPGVSRSRNLGASFASTGNPRGFRAHATWARRLRQRETPGGFALTQPGRVVCVNGKPPGVSRSRNLGASFASTGNPRGFRAHATWARRLRQRETPGGFALTQPGRVVCVNGKPPGVSRSRNLGASFASTGNPRGFRAHATWARRLRQRETPKNIDVFAKYITLIVNRSPSSGCFPDSQKIAHVKPLLKKPNLDKEVFTNYRLVANLKYLGKTIERVVSSRISDHVRANNLSDTFQTAYKPFHGTETALLRVDNDILSAMDDGKITALVLFRLKRLF